MKQLIQKAEESKFVSVLTRKQMKEVLGGTEPGGDNPGQHLCYCDAPILENGQYGIQWLIDSCSDQKIADHCGSGTGTCGACE